MKHKFATALAVSVVLQPLAHGALVLNLLENANVNGDQTNRWVFSADGQAVQTTNGDGTSDRKLFNTVASGLPSAEGTNLTPLGAGVGGTFVVTLESIGVFDSTNWDKTASTGNGGGGTTFWSYDGGGFNFGVRSDAANEQAIQIAGSEAMVLTFDLSGLTGLTPDQSLQVDGFLVWNADGSNPGGQRISYRSSGGDITQLTGDSGEPNALVAGRTVFQPLNQSVGTDDQIAIWATDNTGQKRFEGFQFSVVPEPSSIAMLGLGLGGLCLRRRRTS